MASDAAKLVGARRRSRCHRFGVRSRAGTRRGRRGTPPLHVLGSSGGALRAQKTVVRALGRVQHGLLLIARRTAHRISSTGVLPGSRVPASCLSQRSEPSSVAPSFSGARGAPSATAASEIVRAGLVAPRPEGPARPRVRARRAFPRHERGLGPPCCLEFTDPPPSIGPVRNSSTGRARSSRVALENGPPERTVTRSPSPRPFPRAKRGAMTPLRPTCSEQIRRVACPCPRA